MQKMKQLIFRKQFQLIGLPNIFGDGERRFDEWFHNDKWEEAGTKFNDYEFIQRLYNEDKTHEYYLCYFGDAFNKFPKAWAFLRIRLEIENSKSLGIKHHDSPS